MHALKLPLDVLRRRGDFLRIQKEGRRFKQHYLTILASKNQQDSTRVGITVSRKVGTAVVRNRLKRRLRALLREEQMLLQQGLDYVVIAFPNAVQTSPSALRQDLLCALQRV